MKRSLRRRREFLQLLGAAAASAPYLGRAAVAPAGSTGGEKLPPVRVVTRGPKFHWRGYYDKLLFSADRRFLLAHQVDFEGRSPRPDDVIRVGMIDLHDGDRWTELGVSRAWNWQQGCMLQWLPGSTDEMFWNDRMEDRFVCHVINVHTAARRTLPHPVYGVSPDGRWAVTPDFRRLNDCRPGYGYAGLPDPGAQDPAPADAGIWKMDMRTGARELLFSFAAIAAIPHPAGYSRGAKHWFNHLLCNTDGTRFLFLHRWRGEKEGKSFATRMFTADPTGKNLHLLDPHGRTSHFIWRDPHHVMAWAWHPSHQERFYLYRDQTDQVEVVGPDVMTGNGHNTYVPGTNDQWVLNDTYPDKQRLQHPYLYHLPTRRRVALGHFHSPTDYAGEWRCDTHPTASRDGRQVAIDSTHGGNGRQVYVIDIAALLT